MHDRLKRTVHRTLVRLGAASLSRRRHSDAAVILAYHNIVPNGKPGDGEESLHLDQDTFGRQLDLLCETHEVRRLDEILAPSQSGRPRAAITFDDAYLGALTAGLRELRSRNLPATYFVSPALLDRVTFWWDAIAAAHSGLLPDEIRRTALSAFSGRQQCILRWAKREGIGLASVPGDCQSADLVELHHAASQPGITIGSHTWNHPNLSRLDRETVREEIENCREWLEGEFDSAIPWLAYPYGLPPASSSRSALDDGERAVTTEAGFLDPGGPGLDPRALPRINIPSGMSLARFELLTSGI